MLTRYKTWADTLLYDAVAKLTPDELTMPRPIVFGSILRTLHHTYAMECVWKAHLLGRSHELETRNPQDCPPLVELASAQVEMNAWYAGYVDALPAAQHGEEVRFTFIGGGDGAMTREAILLHVVNHATYHRGHIGDMMYDCSVTPPTTDLPVYLTQA